MASRAPHRAIKLPAALEIAPALEPAFDQGHKFLQLPFLDQGARDHDVARGFAVDPGFEDGLEHGFLVFGEQLDGVALRAPQRTSECVSAAVGLRSEEPAE